ncbi:pilus assembly protein TadG-related protein [Ornithinimicrobium cryptoxanthini]|uniref:Pilus assembly protein TadG-related protein n=1 Tax=Ornithinimicrobium cryptoxanthini TaxID=2934161 RepID=A0ABY4YLH7_9MICO|nr:pilus assembly protein TadG-related protein [Ornithinimicrobium cryptoxanthini]USQ77464.1 pilus assembly protein TadG-related protein [Ornithinimicrobium cryptoxanthini]
MRRVARVVRRASPERGAAAILVALLLTALLGAAGLAIDLGASYVKKQQLQNGADAAAIALAQDHAFDGCAAAANPTEATNWVQDNINNGSATGDPSCPEGPTGSVLTVLAEGEQDHWFIPILPGGPKSSEISASATVEWGTPIAGAGFPIVFSECVFNSAIAQAGEYVEVWIPKKNDKDPNCSSYDYPNGGFGWLNGTDCVADYAELQPSKSVLVPGDPGNNDSTECKWAEEAKSWPRKVLIPVFDGTNGVNGNGHAFYVYKFASFELAGVAIQSGNERHGADMPANRCSSNPGWSHKSCIYGRFVQYVSVDDAFKLGPVTDPDTLVVRFKKD